MRLALPGQGGWSRKPENSGCECGYAEEALNEAVLIRKARTGDGDAFRRLVDNHAGVVWTVINRMTRDKAKAEDLFQEAIIRFWKGLPSFQGNSKLSTWLYSITYRVCLDFLKAEKRYESDTSLDDDSVDYKSELMDPDHSGKSIENKVEAKEAVEKSLAKLNPEWRTMLILYYWKGLAVDEIAEITQRPVNTVKVYLHRARSKMREILETGGYPQE